MSTTGPVGGRALPTVRHAATTVATLADAATTDAATATDGTDELLPLAQRDAATMTLTDDDDDDDEVLATEGTVADLMVVGTAIKLLEKENATPVELAAIEAAEAAAE